MQIPGTRLSSREKKHIASGHGQKQSASLAVWAVLVRIAVIAPGCPVFSWYINTGRTIA